MIILKFNFQIKINQIGILIQKNKKINGLRKE